MISIKTYQDLIEASGRDREKIDFIFSAISEHKSSEMYKIAVDAEKYAKGKNATIMNYQKLLYTLKGDAVPDNYSANHKCASGFFKRFITQEVAYLLGNGITFKNEKTKEKLGKNFDTDLYKAAKSALVQAVVFGFYNNGKIIFYKLTEFVPLYDEETGELLAGIWFWQLDDDKPIRVTLFEPDGYTEYIKTADEDCKILHDKRKYKQIVKTSVMDGEIIVDEENYNGFPIVPLWANPEKQSEIVGRREQIDCYDLIKSGFANDLDDASMIYWTLENAGGMEDIDLVKFKEHMKLIGVAKVGGDDDDAPKAVAHTVDVPHESRESYLSRLEKDLYKDFMALDVEQIAAGNITATQIQAAYEPLNEKSDEFELCIIEFLNKIFKIAGVEDTPIFNRSQIVNQQEQVEMILLAAEYLDEDTILEKLPFLSIDEITRIKERRIAEGMQRFKLSNGG